MVAAFRLVGLGGGCLAALCGCGSSSYSSEFGTTSTASSTSSSATTATGGFATAPSNVAGTHDTVESVAATKLVSVEVGTRQTVSIAFTSSDGNPITGFGLSSAIGMTLPSGWSVPSIFGCAELSTGSGCVLNLTFAPSAYEIGQTLTLDYVYVNNAQVPVLNGSFTLNYQATTDDNVQVVQSPVNQVTATLHGGSQSVTETFTTDDGHPATALALTSDPNALPPGWSAPTMNSCATVSDGAACQLMWTYTPTVPGNGMITVEYTYLNDSGIAKTSSFNISYLATDPNNVPGPSVAPITVAVGSSQVVTTIFTTDDGLAANNLSMDLSNLPAGWSSGPSPFMCSTISGGGSPCALSLNYAPTAALATTTLTLPYNYVDNAGSTKFGSLIVYYTAI